MKVPAVRILMMVENYFPQDTRVKNEADLLTDVGYDVSVIALRDKDQIASEVGKPRSGLPCATFGTV